VTQSTYPTVVSQADQYSDQNQQLITGNYNPQTPAETEQPTEPENVDQKLNRISNRMKEMNTRVKTLESSKQNAYDEKQRRLLMNLDILTRAEQRAESLRKQLFDLVEKENTLKTRLDTIEYDSRPEMIDRQVAFTGTLRPEELRESKKKNLEAEKRNLTNLLTEIQNTRTNLEQNVQKADQLVEKLRAVLEKDIDDALNEQPAEKSENQ
jgi:predicted  nucleic acid-binding Zn-ribbon protein